MEVQRHCRIREVYGQCLSGKGVDSSRINILRMVGYIPGQAKVMANDTAHISPHHFWVAVKNHNAWGYKELVESHLAQVRAVTPTLPIEAMREWASSAPHEAQVALWQMWVSGAELSGFSLDQMKSETKGLLPAVLVIVWTSWARQADLSHYTRENFTDTFKKWPTKARQEVSEAIVKQHPHLASPRIITGQLRGR
jgi:hypothetical protein